MSNDQAPASEEQIKTAYEVADYIAQKGWKTVEVVAGTPKMTAALSDALGTYGIVLKGYNPDAKDERRKAIIEKYGLLMKKPPMPEEPEKELGTVGGATGE
jgi:predicted Rossmann-fold nucleotide-binding protein